MHWAAGNGQSHVTRQSDDSVRVMRLFSRVAPLVVPSQSEADKMLQLLTETRDMCGRNNEQLIGHWQVFAPLLKFI